MGLEWFDRVCSELQDHLESICEKYGQIGHMTVERAAKHPRIEFFIVIDNEDFEVLEREYFCSLFYDPDNEEFYQESTDVETGNMIRIILSDIEEIVDEVHESLHVYINGEDNIKGDAYPSVSENFDSSIEDEEYYEAIQLNNGEIFEEIDVEWTTPEVTAYKHEDEVEVTYQFGVVQETGDGVLRRVNRIWTTEDELIKDESHFIFSKEEANTIIAMIASHMDQLSEFDFDDRP